MEKCIFLYRNFKVYLKYFWLYSKETSYETVLYVILIVVNVPCKMSCSVYNNYQIFNYYWNYVT